MSMYQDTHGRTGGLIMLHNVDAKEKELTQKEGLETNDKEIDFCKEI